MTNKPSRHKSLSARNRHDIVQLARVIQAQQDEIAGLRDALAKLQPMLVQGPARKPGTPYKRPLSANDNNKPVST